MLKIIKSDYDSAVRFISETIETFPNHIKPICIIQNGHVTNPGVSDIDLLIGFDDDFIFAKEFILKFKYSLQKLNNNDIYFPHLPYLYPISILKKLPTLTFNPVKELRVISGTSPFKSDDFLSLEQNILNSFEQLHSRIVKLVELFFSKKTNMRQVLLIGHSLIHSLSLINMIGADLKKEKFQEFLFIESLRQEIENTGETQIISDKRYREICKNLFSEFFKILNFLNFYLDSKICVHFSNSGDFHKYHQSVIFENLYAKRNNQMNINLRDNTIYISGFSWYLKCIFENYFLDKSEFKTIFFDKQFQNAVKDRCKFIKTLVDFNFKNFGNAYGRGGLNPFVKSIEYDIHGKKILQNLF